jgi:hypothetical protein
MDSGEDNNIAIGVAAMGDANNAAIVKNVAIGNYVLDAVGAAPVVSCTAVGYAALSSLNNANASYATAIGHVALYNLTSGASNTAVGNSALYSVRDDGSNTSVGYESSLYLYGGSNVAVGSAALKGMSFTEGGGIYNNDPTITHTADARIIAGLGVSGTGIPDGAYVGSITSETIFELYKDGSEVSTTGGNLTGQTLTFYSRTEGAVAIGTSALTALTSGAGNVAIGYQASDAISTGANNVAIGYNALGAENDGAANTAVGYQALLVQNAGAGDNYNTMVGYQAGDGISTGAQNTGIGASVAFTIDAANQTCVGYGATTASTGANTIMMGNGSMTDIYMGDDGNAWSQVSDERLKRNIEDWSVGLGAINKLRIRQFQFKEDNVFGFSADKVRQGVVAQEAVEALPEMISTNEKGWMSANNESMIWAMVNAIQELSAEVEKLKSNK